jgi:type IV secretion system protein VirD4
VWHAAGVAAQWRDGRTHDACTGEPPTVYVPEANRSAVVIGKAGSGKTFSVIDPMVRSAIEQGHPVAL